MLCDHYLSWLLTGCRHLLQYFHTGQLIFILRLNDRTFDDESDFAVSVMAIVQWETADFTLEKLGGKLELKTFCGKDDVTFNLNCFSMPASRRIWTVSPTSQVNLYA